MDQPGICDTVRKQREFFGSGKTKDISFRIEGLKTLKKVIKENEKAILNGVKADMERPTFEGYGGEIGVVLNEIDYAIKNLKTWTKPKRVRTPLAHFLASSYIYSEPYGVVLVIGPWNYPFLLVITPLVGAIAAGNCSVLKPSEIARHTSNVTARIIGDNFDPSFVSVFEGGEETAERLLSQRFDYIFYTGGIGVGKIVMEAAEKHLTPLTLELGGKSPCIVDRDVHIEYAARRIVWGKFFNAGQSCVAPDYLLVDKAIKKELLERVKKYVVEFYGHDPSKSPDFGRIINGKHYHRVSQLLGEGEIIIGGNTDVDDCYIAPTVIDNVSLDHKIMEEEIFGPILPVIEYEDLADAISIVNERPKPLALYFFSRDIEKQSRVLSETSSGGGCINDTVVHFVSTPLPFGGVGSSGMGNYHGKSSLDIFSHKRSVLKKSFLFDIKLRYPPYKYKLRLLKWFL